MPSPRVLNFEEPKVERTGVQEFFSSIGEAYKDKQDQDTIGNITKEYAQNYKDANSLRKFYADLENSNISPSKRLQVLENVKGIEKAITEKDKVLNDKAKALMANASKKDLKAPIRQGLETLKRQREILATGHLGPKVGIIGTGRKAGSTFSSEGQTLRAEYERLGKSMISLSANIPIRNRQEFEVLAEDLYDPNKSQEEIKGILDAMERILQGSLGEQEESSLNQPTQKEAAPTIKEGQTATGPNGQKIIFKGGKWQPL